MIKKNLGFILILICLVVSILYFFIYPTPKTFPIEDKTKPILIAHAGGVYEGKIYTNSIEAVEHSLNEGYDFIEIDLQILIDNKLGGIHDMAQFNKSIGLGDILDPISSKDFKKHKIYNTLSPLLSDDIVSIFSKNKVYLVTDKIENPELLEKEIPLDKKRMLVETFSYKTYLNHVKYGYDYPMLCIGGKEELEHYWPLFIMGKIKIITFPAEKILDSKEKLEQLIKKDIAIFAFSSNDKNFILKYGGYTVSGFYTDSITYHNLYD